MIQSAPEKLFIHLYRIIICFQRINNQSPATYIHTSRSLHLHTHKLDIYMYITFHNIECINYDNFFN